MYDLIAQLRHIGSTREQHVTLDPPELQIFGGLEARQPPSQYAWDGLKRGADPLHPYLVFQYTLDGWGRYTSNNVTHRLQPGMAFTAIIPSGHAYDLPPASSGWTFFWIIIHHPYIVERIARQQQESGAILTIEPRSPLVLRAVDLFMHACRPMLGDDLTQERVLFEFLWEHERLTRHSSMVRSEGEWLLNDVRHYVRGALPRPVAVTDLAQRHSKSRSHFSHMFKAATGLGPAEFILQIRLEEATRRLLHTDQPVDLIAHATGFANANHFCKVFRQRFHLSPGAFRRQLR